MLVELEVKKLIREIKYLREDIDIKKSMAFEIQLLFDDALQKYLETNIELKDKWDNFNNRKLENIDDIVNKSETRKIKNKKESPDFIKKIYRDIVKKTHPDTNDTGEDIYKEVSVHYSNGDITDIIYIADNLDIDLNISEEDLQIIKQDLKKMKNHSNMIENSIYWKWYESTDKQKFIDKYINQNIYI